ncbi:MAG: threonine-phosphate decarboxylase [Ectothiorhodospiraceae bacterium]|nr:threonine-phosphate decarboxylase [Ectothiorhodospiraceae bacterium]MCH8506118.1 threonine-phosphate decarboxylase CobD [Ectothiorhodospiraceae bacterium]
MEPDHGGRLNAATRRWGIPRDQWLDLSTGLNPWPWPVPVVPGEIWQRLPEEDDGLEQVARRWLGVADSAGLLPVPGSQAIIQLLPLLRPACVVAVPVPGYAEHAHRWRLAGHEVLAVPAKDMDAVIDRVDVAVWIQPNNPDGCLLPTETLMGWHRRLAARGGWLVVDEAFVDATPQHSMAARTGPDGLLVLRSLGKFFGLAGARGGVVSGPAAVCNALNTALGPWAVSGPTRWLMKQALADHAWQADTRSRLHQRGLRLARLLANAGLPPAGSTPLFCYCETPAAEALHDGLAARGILVRRFVQPPALRFGLPPDDTAEQRLAAALRDLV